MAIELNNALFSSISTSSNVGGSEVKGRKSSGEEARQVNTVNRAAKPSVQEAQAKESREQKPNEKSVAEAIEDINSNSRLRMRNLELSINEELNRTVVKVIDAETGEMIRQIPSEKVLQLAEKLQESREPSEVVAGLLLEDES